MKFVVDLLASLIVGLLITGFFRLIVWIAILFTMNVYFVLFVAVTLITLALAKWS